MNPHPPPPVRSPAVPGPRDRVTFLQAQRRHRRTGALLSLPLGLAVLVMGAPLSAVLFPLFFVSASVALDLLNLVVPAPDLWGWFAATGGRFAEGEDAAREVALIVAALCLPGMLTMLGAWVWIRTTLLDTALEGLTSRLGARRPDPSDLEELQLRNVVEEMAIAAGIPTPHVVLVDSDSLNAAALGSSAGRATVVVTRGILDRCDRDETQAIAGHLVATIADGSLRATLRLVALVATLGMVRQLLRACVEPRHRRSAARLIRYARLRRHRVDRAAEAELFQGWLGEDDGEHRPPGWAVLVLPFLMAYVVFNAVALLAGWLVLSPVLIPLLRSRRYLADATAVELTRNPEALRRALQRLSGERAVGFPVSGVANALFLAAPRGAGSDSGMFILDLHPPIARRAQRVGEIAEQRARRSPGRRIRRLSPGHAMVAVGYALIAPLAAVAAGLMALLVPALTGLALAVGMAYASVVAALANLILR